ncbi:putative cytochrome P450 oxidoreductase [Cercophora scortea]|uniref:Cytochrome P450 oxidoreductase n=1 Tax=Cercophora scortea TaxID=314031 RepID=A0AAE0IG03_9PEZI|nr:putative cytochrome P450 oxidoreductase [Cercophora scortea]
MTIQWATAAALVTAGVVVYNVASLVRHVRAAKRIGLPYVILPMLETEIIAQLLTPILRKLYTDQLSDGTGWPRWCRFMIKDWSWEDRRRAHDEYGEVFLVVSPQGIICYSADAAMGWDVMNRRYDFTKPRDKYKGSTYRFHLRMTAPSFADGTGVNDLVWQETARQTRLLMGNWAAKKHTKGLVEDVGAVTLGVISRAGFGKRVESVHEQSQDVPDGYEISFLTGLEIIARHILAILVFPNWFLDLTPWSHASSAKRQLEKYLRAMIRRENGSRPLETVEEGELGSQANLLDAIVEAAREDAKRQAKGDAKDRKKGFTEDEVMGNLFIYLLAGYETTANSIYYGLLALAAWPEVQTKVIEEIDRVYEEAAAEGRSALTYRDDFPKLEYTFGFMYEVFRLYPSVVLITKMCQKPQNIQIRDDKTNTVRTHTLPAECRVYLSAPGVHYHPRYWEEPAELKPERWLTDQYSHRGDDEVHRGKHVAAADKTRQMRGTLLTFSDGGRACLGRKFAQAEYMALFATLLRRYRVKFANGVDVKQAKIDLSNKCGGTLTLSPLPGFRLELELREEVAVTSG